MPARAAPVDGTGARPPLTGLPRPRRARLWAALAAAVVVVAGLVLVADAPRPAPVAPAPSVDASAESPTSVSVTWRSDAEPPRWWVIVSSADDRSVGQRTACGSCRAITVAHLAPGTDYLARVVGVDATGRFGAFSHAVRVKTPPVGLCATASAADTCAAVDLSDQIGPATGVGSGLLHGITPGTDLSAATALRPMAWRVSAGDTVRFSLARSVGASITVLLSDLWMNTTGDLAPWADWDRYRAWVMDTVNAYKTYGALPDYWEVQNEPMPSVYTNGAPATPELVEQQYAVAAQAIRAVVPDAKVIGPSPSYITFGSGLVDVDAFTQRVAADGLPLAALAWHELGGGCFATCDGSPRAVLQHADDARAALARAGLTSVALDVNEWGAPWNFRQPGAAVGFLSSLAYAGVDTAGQTCWIESILSTQSTCFSTPGNLGGLLLDDGRTPTDAWWVHKLYADMTGGDRRLVRADIEDAEASVIATVDGGGTIQVLIGRHTGCQSGVDDNCTGASSAPARSVRLVLGGSVAGARYAVTAAKVPSVVGGLAQPTALGTAVVSATGSTIDAGAWTLGDGEALSVTLVPTP